MSFFDKIYDITHTDYLEVKRLKVKVKRLQNIKALLLAAVTRHVRISEGRILEQQRSISNN